ncbi:MAG: hypothetical protein QNJ30_03900 [Kiloniellales bacterium]|nr:hypothetical protein [Kiloniellales bacterium]
MKGFCRCALLVLLLAGCGEDQGPQVEFVGGGFILNYRQAEMTYGFVARIKGEPPEGSVLEAVFEDPAGGPPIVIRQKVLPTRRSYTFETRPVEAVRKDRDYQVELRLLAPVESGERVIAQESRSYRSQLDAEILPEQPLAVGPGYHRPDGSVPTPESQERR